MRGRKKLILIVSVLVILVAGGIVGFLISSHLSKKSENSLSKVSENPLLNIKRSVNFPLYYPNQLPDNFYLDKNSVKKQEETVFYSYSYNGTTIVVTQQTKPPLMEQVKKTKDLETSIGKAYIADLEGKVVGFIVTDKTLVIISNANKNDAEALEEFMKAFKPA